MYKACLGKTHYAIWQRCLCPRLVVEKCRGSSSGRTSCRQRSNVRRFIARMSVNSEEPVTKLAERESVEEETQNPSDESRRSSDDSKRRVRVSLPPLDEEEEEEQKTPLPDLEKPGYDYEPIEEEPEPDDLEHLFDANYEELGSIREKPMSIESEDKGSVRSVSISVDFVLHNRKTDPLNLSLLGSKEKSLDMLSVLEENEDEDEYKHEHEEEDERPRREIRPDDISIDRGMYCQMFEMFFEKKKIETAKNNILQSKMAAYYLRRKMYYVLKEPAQVKEAKATYEHNLELLSELYESSERERELLAGEINNLKVKHDLKEAELDALFEKLQQAERAFGKTLTFERTGRENMDKLVDKFLKRQKTQTNVLSKLRLSYFRLRNKFNETNRALEALDYLGPGFHIMNYVQLKLDNRNLHDRLEEKDGELIRLREACRNVTQILAHNREKASVMNLDVEKKRDDLESIESDFIDAREQLSYLKRERDELRQEIKVLKLDYGLLTHPKMLRDMENSTSEINEMEEEIERHKEACKETTSKIVAVRKNMEAFVRLKRKEEMKRNRPDLCQSDSSSISNKSQEATNPIVVKQLKRVTLPYL